MRTIAFNNAVAGANTVSWKVDRDCVIVGLATLGAGSSILSNEPDLTIASAAAPSSSAVVLDVFRLVTSSASGTYSKFENITVPIEKDTILYVCFNQSGAAYLQLEESAVVIGV